MKGEGGDSRLPSGVSGTLKVIGTVVIGTLAVVAALAVFELISLATAGDVVMKMTALGVVVAVAAVALGYLTRGGR
ncbi:MAG: hypothetical protein H6983_22925 [Ectothiorhodospiraceae bacterium]|nr:hypothetical protein [Chromatiales bacterium]MCP5157050.1 hypothetical protein [Ectothiorhodospiraceae bacterium]